MITFRENHISYKIKVSIVSGIFFFFCCFLLPGCGARNITQNNQEEISLVLVTEMTPTEELLTTLLYESMNTEETDEVIPPDF